MKALLILQLWTVKLQHTHRSSDVWGGINESRETEEILLGVHNHIESHFQTDSLRWLSLNILTGPFVFVSPHTLTDFIIQIEEKEK